MRIKFILALLITLFTLQFANAQQTVNYTPLDVVRIVTDANLKLNTIYSNRISGHEQERAVLRKEIYAANGELLKIRGILTSGSRIREDKLSSIQKQVTSLNESLAAVDDKLTDVEMQNAVGKVRSKAASLKKAIKKIKK